METLLQDLRYAVRTLLRTPGWPSRAVLTLALGTGVNTAVFGFIDALLFRPAPGVQQSVSHTLNADLGFRTKDALLLSVELPASWTGAATRADYDQARPRIGARPGVESAGWVRTLTLALGGRRGFRPEGYTHSPGEDRELNVNSASSGYFETLGIPLRHGRTFSSADTETSERVVVVNETLARRFFGGAAAGKRMIDSSQTVLKVVAWSAT